MEYKLSERIIGIIVITIKNILSFFPLKTRYSFFENLGLLAYYLIKKRRVLTIDNIKHAFPEKTDKEVIRIAKESYKTMGKMVMTSIYLDDITSNGPTVVENEELIL